MNYTTQLDRLDLFLIRWGIAPEHVPWIGALIGSLLVFVVMGLLSKLLNLLLTIGLKRFSTSTRTHFDDHLLHYRVPRYVARIVPLVLSYHLVPIILRDEGTLQYVVLRAFNVFFIVLFIRIVRAFMRAGRDTLKDSPTYRDKPLDSYVQIASLVIYVIAGILIFSQLTGRSALTFLTAMGAASAVLLLIFKDAILGFVASIQISANDMVRPGDWITMPKYGADGDIVEINLTTVKVANWDKTITTIPTYALIAEPLQNWRGMQDSGGRRIKRSILIKVNSIRYLEPQEIKDLERIQILAPFIKERQAEIAKYNEEHQVDATMPVNGRRITNVGMYRKYIDLYLSRHPKIHQDMTRMVRQLPPDEHGLPLEVYCFTNTTDWVPYEGIIGDIFDHLFAASKFFHLVIFELPAADDMRHMVDTVTGSNADHPTR